MVVNQSTVELLGAGIDALAHADAAQLQRLAKTAQEAGRPANAAEQGTAQERLRTLGTLLRLTRRNLRLLRGADGYGPPRG